MTDRQLDQLLTEEDDRQAYDEFFSDEENTQVYFETETNLESMPFDRALDIVKAFCKQHGFKVVQL